MKFLLDTHVLLWWTLDDPRLPASVRTVLTDPANDLLLSAASGWEIAIKTALGKLEIEGSPEEFLSHKLPANDIIELPVSMAHVVRVFHLPMHHKDPFDRLLIAQAQVEALTILSDDAKLRLYPVTVSW